MIDLAFPWDIVALAAAVAAMLGVLRLATGGEPVNMAVPFSAPSNAPWPRGVQEEEPAAWRFEVLDRRPSAARNAGPAPRRAPRPVVATDPS